LNQFSQQLGTPSVISHRALPFIYSCSFRPGPPIGLAGVHLSTDRNSY